MDCSSNDSATLKQDGNCDGDEVERKQVKELEITAIMVVNKGKRTKRQRPHNSDSSVVGDDDNDDDDDEQMDMAECLILLAQGQSRPSSSYSPPAASVLCNQSGQLNGSKRRRSYSSSNLSLGLAAGVYECQTCNRTFSSFQALGGHRASHKKLNTTSTNTSYHDYFINPLSLQLGNINYSRAEAPPNTIPTTSAIVINKIHECTICGAEFSSGQALGGHMRRHRGHVVNLNSSTQSTNTNTIVANTTLSLTLTTTAGKVVDRISNGNDCFLSLDLNMPASPSPEVDTMFSLHPKQQSAAMVFSTTRALIDCFH